MVQVLIVFSNIWYLWLHTGHWSPDWVITRCRQIIWLPTDTFYHLIFYHLKFLPPYIFTTLHFYHLIFLPPHILPPHFFTTRYRQIIWLPTDFFTTSYFTTLYFYHLTILPPDIFTTSYFTTSYFYHLILIFAAFLLDFTALLVHDYTYDLPTTLYWKYHLIINFTCFLHILFFMIFICCMFSDPKPKVMQSFTAIIFFM